MTVSARKAYIGFDLDSTLGFFNAVGPLAYFWSPEFLENPEQARHNRPLNLSYGLKNRLKRARLRFASNLLARRDLFEKIIRPNLNTLIDPLIKAKVTHKIGAIIIYSNTGNCYTTELAKTLIEREYKRTGLFSLLADAFHPLRTPDQPVAPPPKTYIEPLKTFPVLTDLFQEATGNHKLQIQPSQVAFIDDRSEFHDLYREVPNGLLYIQPTPFVSHITRKDKKEILQLAFDALDAAGLLKDPEYMRSGICNRLIPYDFVHAHEIRGFPDLITFVWREIEAVQTPRAPWRNDGFWMERALENFLEKF